MCDRTNRTKPLDGHAPNEITWKDDLVKCAAIYAGIPALHIQKG